MNDVAWNFSDENRTFSIFNSEMDFIAARLSGVSRGIVAAVSGGSDSLALLVLLENWTKFRKIPLECVTVDHKLRLESSDEALFVREFCRKTGINHDILEWAKNFSPSHGKVENLARDARYKLISDFCERRSRSVAAVGHTWNDQLETFEMRKSFKSADCGLAGMSRIHSISESTKIIRPVMIFTKEHLKKFLISKGISWINDPMNDDATFKRVFHRKNILLFDQQKLLQKTSKIKSFGKKRRETEKQAVSFLKRNIDLANERFGYFIFDLFGFLQEKQEAQMEILKRAIWNIGGKKYAPKIDEKTLENIIISKKIKTTGRCLLKVNKKSIAIFRENRNLDKKIAVNKNGSFLFDDRFLVSIKNYEFHGRLTELMILSYKTAKEFRNYSDNCFELPREALCGLPCVCANGELLSACGSKRSCLDRASIKYNFLRKANLFDVFL